MTIFGQLAEFGVVPVISIYEAKDALPLADALLEGGLPVAEITFRTPAAGVDAKPVRRTYCGTRLTSELFRLRWRREKWGRSENFVLL